MEQLIQQVLSGLATGSIYASMGLALVMIYQSTSTINFAQGEMAMASTYIAWSLIHAGVPYWPAFLLTIVISFAVGALIERLIVRPFEDASPLTAVVVFVGLLVIVNSLIGWIYSYDLREFSSPFGFLQGFKTAYIGPHQLGMIGVIAIELVCVFLFFRFTMLGLAMRAVAQNPISGSLVGISRGWMLALGWGIAAAVGAIAGVMTAPIIYLDPNMMGGILIYGFAGALLGGITNPWGTVVGGLMIGVIENIAGAYLIGPEIKLSVALIIIIGVLLVKPAGLFGKTLVNRV